jgi:hypothetical protein
MSLDDIAERHELVVDRAAVLRSLLEQHTPADGELVPQLGPGLPADPERVAETARAIGRLHVAERMTPCDEVLWVLRVVEGRDVGDECSCGAC